MESREDILNRSHILIKFKWKIRWCVICVLVKSLRLYRFDNNQSAVDVLHGIVMYYFWPCLAQAISRRLPTAAA
jgi:hypothetical protein